ncbi:penicillin acylase family protein [Flavobacterium succinicans]|uniref:Acyl-homoserine lactone acylase QuiP n=1 Tax=Flavobacterium succinicans TaxID=29536 RepID=A0A199XU38_9FLAO|nr:penicillin acylase family protein [Flavobacterium succinicans]OAZ05278.1 acyl-homoserine lactone acylase QuiP precursor [Flavobacterium succinicans]
MRVVKKIALFLFLFLIVLVLALFGYAFYTKPKYEGELSLQNIDKTTTVYFDDFGVPHIYANSQKDAMVALGYVHAQDRLWQMELMRRIAPGRLSEIFGSVALKNDMFFAGLGIEEASEVSISKLDKNGKEYQLAMAYLDGINQYLEEGKTPIEFHLVGVKKQKFTLKDVYNIFGYMSFSFAMAQKTDPLLTDIRDQLGPEYLKDFGLDGSLGTTRIKNAKEKIKEYSEIAKSVTALLDQSPIPPFIGSNSWVIAPPKTENGKVIFANDPHIGFSQPATWYEAHIVTPDFELYGYYLAGTPYPLLGHNRKYAYGLTMFENDDLDLYKEENKADDTNSYLGPKGYVNYQIRNKTIQVKDLSAVNLQVKISRHGPIVNDLIKGLGTKQPIALSWIYTQQPIQILEAVYQLSHAQNIADFQKGVALIAAPGLNVMYGDAKGNVAWWATGKLYKHQPGVNPNFILNGASGKEDIAEYLDFSKNPSAVNPSWNYVYSANNQPEAVDGFLYPGYYLPEDRAKRITTLLDAKQKWNKQAVSQMIVDNTSSTVTETLKVMLASIATESLSENQKQAFTILKDWKGDSNLNQVAPTIYNKWLYLYLKNTFEDELGKDKFEQFLGTHIGKQVATKLIANPNSIWWDDSTTKGTKETQAFILQKSYKEAVVALEKQLGTTVASWTWNKVHTVEHQHPLGKVSALKPIFNVGPFEIAGTNEVINNLMFGLNASGNYKVTGGPSTRRVIDFSDVENSWSIIPTGQSGNPMSAHYADQTQLYNEGKFRKMKMNKAEIVTTSTKLIFNPIKK